jgi:predicted metal-dependent peptidase
LPDGQAKGVLIHEVMHKALRHDKRGTYRLAMVNNVSVWNIVCDWTINHILSMNGFELPVGGLNVGKDGTAKVFGIEVNGIDVKATEELYDELFAQLKRMAEESGQGEGDGPDRVTVSGFGDEGDPDKTGSGPDGKEPLGEGQGDGVPGAEDIQGIPVDWGKVLSEAVNHAKHIGKAPAGFAREYGEIHTSRLPWNKIIRKGVSAMLQDNLSYRKPSKRYMYLDLYQPTTYGERVVVTVSIDTSGSMGKEEFTEIMSELNGMTKHFKQVEFHILTHDSKVHDDYHVKRGTIDKLKALELHGGGGTSHRPVYEYLEKVKWRKHAKLLISFTDGYSDFPENKPSCETIFILTGGHCPKENLPQWAKRVYSIHS